MQPDKSKQMKSLLSAVLAVGVSLTALAGVKKGDVFPDLSAFGLEGTLPDTKGKVVLVDFWASWCGPCKESFPAMNELQQKFAPQGVVIIAINVDENKADMETFLKEHKADFAVIRDARQKLVDKAGIGTMPSSFILDKDGKVLAAHSGFEGEKSRKHYEEELTAALK